MVSGCSNTFSNLDANDPGVYTGIVTNMSSFVGQTIEVRFEAASDASLPTTFRIDNISLAPAASAPSRGIGMPDAANLRTEVVGTFERWRPESQRVPQGPKR